MLKLSGLAAELQKEIVQLPVIDTHEHLPTEAERVAKKVDVTTFLSHYCRADLESAGLAGLDVLQEKHEVLDTSKPLLPRWKKLKPYYEAIRHGSYAWPGLAYVRDVLGFDDINDSTVEAISQKLQADNKPGLYKKIFQKLCRIEKAIQCKEGVEQDQPFFVYLCRDRTCRDYEPGPNLGARIAQMESLSGRAIHTLADFVDVLGWYVGDQKRRGAVGLKVGCAYRRTIEFADVSAGDADRVFVKTRASMTPVVSEAEQEALENYLIRREVEACIEHDLPVAIHTGYQAGIGNDIRNARATLLWSLLHSYPQARFDLFHGSFPYVSDMTVLGKYFPNVVLNMCWMHIMGPDVSRRALSEWLDAVPVTKIFAFGGDFLVVEEVYGHLQLAQADVAAVLAEKVQCGRMTETDALHVARLLFYENPKRWYRLG